MRKFNTAKDLKAQAIQEGKESIDFRFGVSLIPEQIEEVEKRFQKSLKEFEDAEGNNKAGK